MEGSALQRFENLIRARSGLSMREQEAPLLQKTLAQRTQALRFGAPEQYLDFLASKSAEAQSEWDGLFVLLTNQETYFFRDAGQLNVIRERILPALIARNRQNRTLRIWSAGCSTGEEVYSLAMMLDELLPMRDDWKVVLLGTDLSAKALGKARAGIYGDWSFRMMDADKQNRYFVARGNQWEVKPQLRQNVIFALGNLLLDEFPSRATEMHEIDLIVCRNVFIYFAREAISQVLRKFNATLRPEGYLVTGHSELHGAAIGDFQVQAFPQSVVYQRPAENSANTPRRSASATNLSALQNATRPHVGSATRKPTAGLTQPESKSTTETRPITSRPVVPRPVVPRPVVPESLVSTPEEVTKQAIALIRAGNPNEAVKMLQLLLESQPRNLAALCLLAQVNANRGRLEEAEMFCQRAIEVAAFAPLPYQLLARIAAERGDNETAKTLLKKVTYLNPESVMGYLELSAIYEREGDATRASQMQRAAHDVLNTLSDEALLLTDEYALESALTVGELKRQLQSEAAH